MKLKTVTAPAYWASYFVSGEASGLHLGEVAHIEAWKRNNQVLQVVDIARHADGEPYEPRFTNFYRLYDPMADCESGEVLDYVCEEN
jgi:hypothetical protein